MSSRRIPLAALLATAVAASFVTYGAVTPADSHAESAPKWRYAEIKLDPTRLEFFRGTQHYRVDTDVSRDLGDVWTEMGNLAGVIMGDGTTHIALLDGLGRSGWELVDVTSRSWTPAAPGVTTWTLRRPN